MIKYSEYLYNISPKIKALTITTFKSSIINNWLSETDLKTKISRPSQRCRLKLAMPERPIPLNTSHKIQASCSDCSYFMRCRNNLPYATGTYRLICFVSTIPGKFQPTGSYNHTDKSGQLPKTEPLRLHCSSLQSLWHWQLVTGSSSENENKQAVPMMQAKACTDGTSYILEYPS